MSVDDTTPGRESILVIDDDAFLRRLCKIVLEDAGYTVHQASNGAEGLATLREQSADLVVCDLFMPEMDGIEMIMALKQQSHGCKVLAISGVVGGIPSMLPAAQALGAIHTLAKPFTPDALVTAVRAALDADA